MSRIVAIVGRPNVGKSTLFNRLTDSRDAIVDEISGVTRDRNYGSCNWNGIDFSVIDTGGYVENSDDLFEGEINKQVMLAIEESDIILFMVDVTSGIHELDKAVASMLRKANRKIFLVVNKVDNSQRLLDANEFYGLGLGEYYPLSSMSGSGTGELLDAVVSSLPDMKPEEIPDLPRIAIVGRPTWANHLWSIHCWVRKGTLLRLRPGQPVIQFTHALISSSTISFLSIRQD